MSRIHNWKHFKQPSLEQEVAQKAEQTLHLTEEQEQALKDLEEYDPISIGIAPMDLDDPMFKPLSPELQEKWNKTMDELDTLNKEQRRQKALEKLKSMPEPETSILATRHVPKLKSENPLQDEKNDISMSDTKSGKRKKKNKNTSSK